MAVAPQTREELLALVRKSGLVPEDLLDAYLEQEAADRLPPAARKFAARLVRDGLLTNFQAHQLLLGKWRGFTVGKYQVLEQLGLGGMGRVYLCSHLFMRRLVAIKVLSLGRAEQPAALARFYREARAAASLDHPNIVRAYDSGQEGDLHFLVMEYVDGTSLQQIVKGHGPLDLRRAAHYVCQAALGLQHLHETGLIHRDIKPSNLLLDRQGTIKILDLGLSRFFHDQRDGLTKQFDDKSILGTADYLSPEQARNSHEVDIRTDIYGLGATFYFLLTGRSLFQGKTLTQKLLSHQLKEPTPLRELRPEVPETLAAVVAGMMAKDPADRYPVPAAVVEALGPWTDQPAPPPPTEEMPRLCQAVRRMALTPGEQLSSPPVPEVRAAAVLGPGYLGNGFQAGPPMELAPRGSGSPSRDSGAHPAGPPLQTPRPGSNPLLSGLDTPSTLRRGPDTNGPAEVTGHELPAAGALRLVAAPRRRWASWLLGAAALLGAASVGALATLLLTR
jgi:serine/threonine protein kinase